MLVVDSIGPYLTAPFPASFMKCLVNNTVRVNKPMSIANPSAWLESSSKNDLFIAVRGPKKTKNHKVQSRLDQTHDRHRVF